MSISKMLKEWKRLEGKENLWGFTSTVSWFVGVASGIVGVVSFFYEESTTLKIGLGLVALISLLTAFLLSKIALRYRSLMSRIEAQVRPEVVKSLKKRYMFTEVESRYGKDLSIYWLQNAAYQKGYDSALLALTLDTGDKVLFNAVIKENEVYLEPTPEGAKMKVLRSISKDEPEVSEEDLIVDGYTLEEFRE